MITSMREHEGALYLGGVTNDKIGRLTLDGADQNWRGPRELLGERTMMTFFRSRRQEPPAMTLEGMLGPNGRLDDAAGISGRSSGRAVRQCRTAGLLVSSGTRVLALGAWGDEAETVGDVRRAGHGALRSAGGLVAVGLAGGRVAVLRCLRAAGRWLGSAGRPTSRPWSTACSCRRTKSLLVDSGYGADARRACAGVRGTEQARGQLMALRRIGRDQRGRRGLHCPMGVCRDAQGERAGFAARARQHRRCLGPVRQSGYPGYLGRIRRTATGYVIACLSRRDPLIEFLKTRDAISSPR